MIIRRAWQRWGVWEGVDAAHVDAGVHALSHDPHIAGAANRQPFRDDPAYPIGEAVACRKTAHAALVQDASHRRRGYH